MNLTYQLNCTICNNPYGQINSNRQPLVIACGHSFCRQCIYVQSSEYGHFQYQGHFCSLIIDAVVVKASPHNKLYYQALAKIKQIVREKEFQSPVVNKSSSNWQVKREKIKPQEKCQFAFCFEKRYIIENKKELFCSKRCKQLFQQICVIQMRIQ